MRKGFAWAMLWLLCGGVHSQQHTVTYIYTDPQGTPLAEADANGNITATYDYRPYGVIAMGASPNGAGYTGHVNDPDTGLVYMQARYYDPVAGRFLSVDPAGPEEGDYFNFARYTYGNNNPIRNIDQDGRQITPAVEVVPPGAAAGEAAAAEAATAEAAAAAHEAGAAGAAGGVGIVWIDPMNPASMGAKPPSPPSTVQANKAAGDAFESKYASDLKAAGETVSQQITIKTASGVKTRVDIVTRNANGDPVCTECKASETAPLTKNQKAAFPEIQRSGATVVGQGKPGFPGGTRIPPQTVKIVRPPPPPPAQPPPQPSN